MNRPYRTRAELDTQRRALGISLLLSACAVDDRTLVARTGEAEAAGSARAGGGAAGDDISASEMAAAAGDVLPLDTVPDEEESAQTRTCRVGRSRCASATETETCTADGQWGSSEPCEFVCIGGECVGECKPAARRCDIPFGDLDVSSPEECNAAGLWEAQPPCPECNECAGAGECIPLPNDCGALACGESPSGCHACGSCSLGDLCAAGSCGCTPIAARTLAMPALPSDLKLTCPLSGSDLVELAPDCPVVSCGGVTYFALSFVDNRIGIAIVGYDTNGQIVSRRETAGARYIHDIAVRLPEQTVTFTGQADDTVVLSIAELRE